MLIKNIHHKIDSLGIGVSLLCAVHCALLPLLITMLPLLGLGILANNYFEGGIITVSLIIGYTSLATSCGKHGHKVPLMILTSGFVLIFIGKVLASRHYEWLFLVMGGLLIAGAHFYNSRLNMQAHETD